MLILSFVVHAELRFGGVVQAFKLLGQRRSEFTLPIYAHHGTLDKITSMPATK